MKQHNLKPDQLIQFECNICGHKNKRILQSLTRENPSCDDCGSTVRMRSIIQVLTTELFGSSLTIDEIDPPRPDIIGVGMSCWEVYVYRIAHKIAYTNTYYHQAPYLDITNIDPSMEGTLDFVVSTDVFEHVAPPISEAFINARRLLKPGGLFLMSVPFDRLNDPKAETKEWFPNLHDWKLIEVNGQWLLKNTTKDGKQEEFDDLCFHGGPGTTLEMRLFSKASLIRELREAGFNDITIYSKPDLAHGVYWGNGMSTPIAARVQKKKYSWLEKWRTPTVRVR